MRQATLGIITRSGKVLLGNKKKGEIGTGTYNGPGGKVEPGESILDCLVRETKEELNITIDRASLWKAAVLTFYVGGVPDFRVHTYRVFGFSGTPIETADMIPEWFWPAELPFDRMLEADRSFFPLLLEGESFNAHVYYREKAKGFEHIDFLPYASLE